MIRDTETEIQGEWVVANGTVSADANAMRIESLTREHLREIGRDVSGWDVLYVDPNDGRHWELTYAQSGLHGGGPPRLAHLSGEEVRQKYAHLANGSDR